MDASSQALLRSIQSARKSNFLPFSSTTVRPQFYSNEHFECVRVDNGIAPSYNTFSKVAGWNIIFFHNVGNTKLSSWRRAIFSELHETVFNLHGVTSTSMKNLFEEVHERLISQIKKLEEIEPEVEYEDYEDEDSMKRLEPENWLPHLLSTVVAIKDNRHVIVGGPGPCWIGACGVTGCRVISVPESSTAGGVQVVEVLIHKNEHLLFLPREFDIARQSNQERLVATVAGNTSLLGIAQSLLQHHSEHEDTCVVVLKPVPPASAG